ncbi:MAG: leucine--tRNA ligase [Bacteroidia bacterium]|jgi:leucyl-tRNA synthetase|nr:leucine--tRNA ligase [Bacteroidia bacterium]
MDYNFTEIEKKWQAYWAKHKTFRAENNSDKPKYYVLDMFPYPSGAGLHVGHPLGYIASDIMARFKRHQGFNVLHPMGYDSFGLPAEQYAIQTGQHPAITTEQNITRYREQLDKIGFSFDWEREVRTSDPGYYKWTQWIFLQLYNAWYNPISNKAEPISTLIAIFERVGYSGLEQGILTGDVENDLKPFNAVEWKNFDEKTQNEILMNFRLAYLGEAYVNWCPALGTVLANDEVKDGVSERGGYPVERKLMKQWSMRITAYAQRLLDGLNNIDWPESLKESQRYWIGRSEGSSIKFKIQDSKEEIEVFTTRPDTIFGVAFLTLAPEHPLVEKITTKEQAAQVKAYIEKSKNRSERERQAEIENISGVFTGAYAEHPFMRKQVPVWVGDYVLVGYGTGAVMAVPAHDQRDFRFAKHFGIERPQVILPNQEHDFEKTAWEEKTGTMQHSGFLNNLLVNTAITEAIKTIEERGIGKHKINYRLRDAVFGRQRYWGEPIPIYYKEGIPYPIPESELPLKLPEVDKFLPTEEGEPPLARAKNWKYQNKYEFEHSTMPGWAGSSWYYLRYMDAQNKNTFSDKKAMQYWQNVDLYIGGSEHATGHLLYVRFWTKALFDLGHVPFDEPMKKLINQGMIQGTSSIIHRSNKDNKIVSAGLIKNYDTTDIHIDVNLVENNVVNIEALKKWRDDFSNVSFELEDGKLICSAVVEKMSKRWYNVVTPDLICEKFGADTLRLYEMFLGPLEQSKPWNTNGITGVSGFLKKLWRLFHSSEGFKISEGQATKAELKTLHKTIKKISEDIERFSFNTSVSTFMICVNELGELKCNKKTILEPLLVLISPYAPHIAEELWEKLGHTESIARAAFPEFKAEYLIEDSFNYPISFNGKMRLNIELPATLSATEIEKEVLSREEVQKHLNGANPKKIIVVPKKIVNIVV